MAGLHNFCDKSIRKVEISPPADTLACMLSNFFVHDTKLGCRGYRVGSFPLCSAFPEQAKKGPVVRASYERDDSLNYYGSECYRETNASARFSLA